MRPVTLTMTMASGVDSSRSRNLLSSNLASRKTLRCVTSRLVHRKYFKPPPASRIALVEMLTCTSEPSLRRRTDSWTIAPRCKASCRMRASSSTRSSGTTRSVRRFPTASSALKPKVGSLAPLQCRTTPSGETPMTESGVSFHHASSGSMVMRNRLQATRDSCSRLKQVSRLCTPVRVFRCGARVLRQPRSGGDARVMAP